jgi:NAD(P)-dependent dehydrogenase (short-subunit alcohol dehydrogenase family)
VLPLLRAAEGARVVSLSSLAARQSGEIHFDDLQFEKSYALMQACGQAKLAVLMLAGEFDRRSREADWGIKSNPAHPGLTKTNLQTSGPSHDRSKPSVMERLYKLSWRLTPFLWQDIDDGSCPRSMQRCRRTPRVAPFTDLAGSMRPRTTASNRPRCPARARNDADSRRLWQIL